MNGVIDWASQRARMIFGFIVLSLLIGTFAYVSLPKEGEPDIEIPALFVSVPFPGISATDSETLLVKPMETELSDLDGLKSMTGTAAEGYAGVALEFEFGWDKSQIMADVREAMKSAEAKFPDGADEYSINEVNFSEFPILIVNLSGPVPERTLNQIAKNLQDRVESLDAVLEAGIAAQRDEMLEVVIDPLKLESYNVTADDLIRVVQGNNQLIAAGEIRTEQGTFAVKIPSNFSEAQDVWELPVKVNGDRVVTLGDLASLNLTFEDREGTARFDGAKTVALQVVKRKGFNVIDTAAEVRAVIEEAEKTWPEGLRAVLEVGASNDQSVQVNSMVKQLEGSVLTAIALVMIVMLATLGLRPSLLVGFAIPTSFLLCFALLAAMNVSISNMVMFGLILAVGMLVDGAIVVVEYADKRIEEGSGPMSAYVEAAKRMFWPVTSSTATTLCAFLPLLFWPGVPGQFMRMLPITLIFVLSASLVVALIYLPVMGGMLGRLERLLARPMKAISDMSPLAHLLVVLGGVLAILGGGALAGAFGFLITTSFGGFDTGNILGSVVPILALAALLALGIVLAIGVALSGILAIGLAFGALFPRIGRTIMNLLRGGKAPAPEAQEPGTYRRSPFGRFIALIADNPIGPIVAFIMVVVLVGTTFVYYGQNNKGTEFFVATEPEQAVVYVRARGNLSLAEKDAVVKRAEAIVLAHPGVSSVFAFAGQGGLDSNTGGAPVPGDTIGQVQFETIPWDDRADYARTHDDITLDMLDGDRVIAELNESLSTLPGVVAEILSLSVGPASAKPVHLRIQGDDWETLLLATATARLQFDQLPGLTLVEDTLPLPGIDWQIDVDVEKAGRFGADVATVGAMIQLVTRGIQLDTYTPNGSDEEIEIRVRLPESYRILSTLDTLKLRTNEGLVPLSNFITQTPVAKLAEINREDQKRYFDVKAGVEPGLMYAMVDEEPMPRFALRALPEGETAPLDEPRIEHQGSSYSLFWAGETGSVDDVQALLAEDAVKLVAFNPNVAIASLTSWLEDNPMPLGMSWEWTGDQEDQEESGQFLMSAFGASLGLMFIILLAQFNSIYNSVLVLLAVILSSAGVLIGLLVMGHPFSIIMTGTGVLALAGIVVNNNIVLIDTFQEYRQDMPHREAIIRTAEDRIRPVLLTTITTMAGLAPMMFGLSVDFFGGGFTIDSPTALWWKNLATAVVFGLGIATGLTLIFTPAMLAMRVWVTTYALWIAEALGRLSMGRGSQMARDWAEAKQAKREESEDQVWTEDDDHPGAPVSGPPLRAAE